MAEKPESIVLEDLGRFDARQSRFEDALRAMSARLSSIESYLAAMHGDVARHSGEIDAIRARLDRIERRLDRVDAGCAQAEAQPSTMSLTRSPGARA